MHYIVTDVQCVHYVDTASGGGGKLYRAVNLGSVLLLCAGKSVAVLYDSLPLLWLGLAWLGALGGSDYTRGQKTRARASSQSALPPASIAARRSGAAVSTFSQPRRLNISRLLLPPQDLNLIGKDSVIASSRPPTK